MRIIWDLIKVVMGDVMIHNRYKSQAGSLDQRDSTSPTTCEPILKVAIFKRNLLKVSRSAYLVGLIDNYRVATLSILYLTVTGIIISSFKLIRQL